MFAGVEGLVVVSIHVSYNLVADKRGMLCVRVPSYCRGRHVLDGYCFDKRLSQDISVSIKGVWLSSLNSLLSGVRNI